MITHNSTGSLAVTSVGPYAVATEGVSVFANEYHWIGQYSADGSNHEINQVFYRFEVGQASKKIGSATLVLNVNEIYGLSEIVVIAHEWSNELDFAKTSQMASKRILGRIDLDASDAIGLHYIRLDLDEGFTGPLSIALVSADQMASKPTTTGDDTTLVLDGSVIEIEYIDDALEPIITSATGSFAMSGSGSALTVSRGSVGGSLALSATAHASSIIKAAATGSFALNGSANGHLIAVIQSKAEASIMLIGRMIGQTVVGSSGLGCLQMTATGRGRVIFDIDLVSHPDRTIKVTNLPAMLSLVNAPAIVKIINQSNIVKVT